MEFDSTSLYLHKRGMHFFIVGLFILQLSLNLQAGAVEGVNGQRRDDGGVTLTGENCDLLKRQSLAFSLWKTNLQEKPGKTPTDCTCDSLRCYMEIDPIVPEFVAKYLSVDAGRWGPNCWNTALVAAKILPVLRFTPPEEMNFWMTSPLCQAVPEDETPAPGDIAAIRNSEQTEVHAYTFITDELSFTKNYLTTMAPYKLQSTPDIFAIFPVPFSCRHRSGNPSDCPSYIIYYRCTSFSQFILNQKIILPTRYSEIDPLVLEQEKRVSRIAFEWKLNPPLQKTAPLALKDAQQKIKAVQSEVILRANDKSTPEHERLLWNGLKFRIKGLLQTIDWVD